MTQKIIFILGMHRSGTSAATRLMNIMGADLPGNLLPPNPHINKKGYFEDKAVVALNEAVLAHFHAWYDIQALPQAWWREDAIAPFREKIRAILQQNYSQFDLTLIKDPRLSLLFPLWQETAHGLFETLCVIVLRHPEEVAASLWKRDGLDKSYSYYLWMIYVLSSLSHTTPFKRAFITFDQILSDPCHVSEHLGTSLGIEWPDILTAKKEMLSRDISIQLKHHAWDRERGDPDNILLDMAVDIYYKLASPEPEAYGNDFLEIKQTLDAPNDPMTKALKESLQNTNRRMVEHTIKMMDIGEMHHHALEVLSKQEKTIENLLRFKEKIFSHWAWPIMRRLPARGVNVND